MGTDVGTRVVLDAPDRERQPPAPARSGRRRARRRVPTTAVLLLVGLVGFAYGFGSSGRAVSDGMTLAAVTLTPTGNQDPALFDQAVMVPGHEVGRCIIISGLSRSDGSADAVFLRTEDVTGALANQLTIKIDIGSGAAGDCSDFSGQSLFSGSLADLTTAANTAGLDTGWEADPSSQRTFRIVASVPDDNTIQGQAAGATLRWQVRTPEGLLGTVRSSGSRTPDAGEAPPPTADISVSSPPTSTPRKATGTTATDGATDSETLDVGPKPKASGTHAPAQAFNVPQPRSLLSSLSAAAVGLRDHVAFPIGLIVLLLLYLLIQDRVDRSDPKLALAPMHADPTVDFPADPDSDS